MRRPSLSNMALVAALMGMATMGEAPHRDTGERPPRQAPEVKAAKLTKAEKKRAKRAERNLRLAAKCSTTGEGK